MSDASPAQKQGNGAKECTWTKLMELQSSGDLGRHIGEYAIFLSDKFVGYLSDTKLKEYEKSRREPMVAWKIAIDGN